MLVDQGLELADHEGVAAQVEIGDEASFEHGEPALLEAGGASHSVAPVDQVEQGGAPPERECLLEAVAGLGRAAAHEQGLALVREPGEALDVDVVSGEVHLVAGGLAGHGGPTPLGQGPPLGDSASAFSLVASVERCRVRVARASSGGCDNRSRHITTTKRTLP